jgi:hypothetical protein
MADFNIPFGTTQTISSLSANSTDTVEAFDSRLRRGRRDAQHHVPTFRQL